MAGRGWGYSQGKACTRLNSIKNNDNDTCDLMYVINISEEHARMV